MGQTKNWNLSAAKGLKGENKQLVGSVTLLSLTACGMDRHALF